MLSEALQRNAEHEARLSNISGCDVHAAKRRNLEILRFAQNDNAAYGSTFNPLTFNRSRPLRHLFRERALRAIGIVLHAKIFVDLEQPLLVRDSAQKFFPAGII